MMFYTDIINNVEFQAYYDEDKKAVHVLDAMGDNVRMSVTNGINNLIPLLEKRFKINSGYNIYLYGTDGMIARYDKLNQDFIHVPKESPNVFDDFKNKMMDLYSKGVK